MRCLRGKKPYGDVFSQCLNSKTINKLTYTPSSKYNPLVPYWLDRAIEKSVHLHPCGRYPALSEWLYDLKHPNLKWTSPREQPLIERHPLRFWQICAATGWLVALVLTIVTNMR